MVAAYLAIGKEKALIDMGYRSSAQTIIRDLSDEGIGPDDLDYLLPTHVHLDHCGSCGTLASNFPRAAVLVHPLGEPHLVDPSRLWKTAGELFGDDLMQKYGSPDPISPRRVRALLDGEVVDLGRETVLRALWTPGHAAHHLSYLLEGKGIVFTGDAFGLHHPSFPVLVPTTPPTSFNFEKAVKSLEQIRSLSPSGFLTPHFGVLKLTDDWIARNIGVLLDWKTALEAMTAKGHSVDEMTRIFVEEICRRTDRFITDMPAYFRASIRVSVLGFLRYLKDRPRGIQML